MEYWKMKQVSPVQGNNPPYFILSIVSMQMTYLITNSICCGWRTWDINLSQIHYLVLKMKSRDQSSSPTGKEFAFHTFNPSLISANLQYPQSLPVMIPEIQSGVTPEYPFVWPQKKISISLSPTKKEEQKWKQRSKKKKIIPTHYHPGKHQTQ